MNSATNVECKWSQSDIQKPIVLLIQLAILISVNYQFWPGQCYCHSDKPQAVLPANWQFPWSWSVVTRNNPETVLSAKWHFLPSGSITRKINLTYYNQLTISKQWWRTIGKQTWDCIINKMTIIHCQSNCERQT